MTDVVHFGATRPTPGPRAARQARARWPARRGRGTPWIREVSRSRRAALLLLAPPARRSADAVIVTGGERPAYPPWGADRPAPGLHPAPAAEFDANTVHPYLHRLARLTDPFLVMDDDFFVTAPFDLAPPRRRRITSTRPARAPVARGSATGPSCADTERQAPPAARRAPPLQVTQRTGTRVRLVRHATARFVERLLPPESLPYRPFRSVHGEPRYPWTASSTRPRSRGERRP